MDQLGIFDEDEYLDDAPVRRVIDFDAELWHGLERQFADPKAKIIEAAERLLADAERGVHRWERVSA